MKRTETGHIDELRRKRKQMRIRLTENSNLSAPVRKLSRLLVCSEDLKKSLDIETTQSLSPLLVSIQKYFLL